MLIYVPLNSSPGTERIYSGIRKYIADLLLSQSLGIEHSCQAVTLLFLVAEDRQYLRMEIAIPVAGNTELQLSALAVGGAGAIAIALTARTILQKLTSFRNHHAL